MMLNSLQDSGLLPADPILQLNLFGKPEFFLDGNLIKRLPSLAGTATLVYLVCHSQPVARETLYNLFWPESTEAQAKANFRAVLSHLRKRVGGYLIITRNSVGFDHTQPYRLDIMLFEKEVSAVLHGAGAEPLDVKRAGDLKSWLALYREPFLAGFSGNLASVFDAWAVQQRARLQRLAVLALKRLVGYLEAGDFYDVAAVYNGRFLALNPLDEAATRRQMWLLARLGKGQEARSWYETCRQQLEEGLETAVSPTTEAAMLAIEKLTWPPPVLLPEPDPAFTPEQPQLDSLVARMAARENEGILTLLERDGETAVSLAVAAAHHIHQQQPGRFLHGIFLLDMIKISSLDEFILKLSGTLPSKKNIVQSVKQSLQAQESLLILTHFEHLVENTDIVDFLLGLVFAESKSCIVVCSKKRLMLQAEQIMLIDYASS